MSTAKQLPESFVALAEQHLQALLNAEEGSKEIVFEIVLDDPALRDYIVDRVLDVGTVLVRQVEDGRRWPASDSKRLEVAVKIEGLTESQLFRCAATLGSCAFPFLSMLFLSRSDVTKRHKIKLFHTWVAQQPMPHFTRFVSDLEYFTLQSFASASFEECYEAVLFLEENPSVYETYRALYRDRKGASKAGTQAAPVDAASILETAKVL